MPPRYAVTWAGFASRTLAITGSSSAVSETASCARYCAASKPGSPTRASASSSTGAREPVARLDEQGELSRIDGVAVCAREPVRDQVRSGQRLGAGGSGRLPEPIEPAGHEHERPLEVELALEPADPHRRQLRQLRAQALDELRGRLDRNEIRLGEVAVVVGLLLRPARGQGRGGGVEVVGLLDHLASGLVDRDLARHLGVDPLRDEAERVHVLDLAARPKLRRAGGANRDVGIHAQRSLLHLGIGDPELDDRLPQELEETACFRRGMDVGSGDDLHERSADAVEVDERVLRAADPPGATADVDRLRRVLLEVRADDPDLVVAVHGWD